VNNGLGRADNGTGRAGQKINTSFLTWQRFPEGYLCVPASSASRERAFSAAGITISQRHTSLDPDTVDNIYSSIPTPKFISPSTFMNSFIRLHFHYHIHYS